MLAFALITSHPVWVGSEYDRKDHYYNLAKSQGYRSRAAYKLKEIQKKYSFIKQGYKVVDFGAWPGGWMQVASELVGKQGKVIGIDLVEIEEFQEDSVSTLVGNVSDEQIIAQAKELACGQFDIALSDMSPKLSGIKEADRWGAVACAELALWAAGELLKVGGTLIIKVFKSHETDEFVKVFRKSFSKVVRTELDSTRKTSNEYYLLGFGYKGSCQ